MCWWSCHPGFDSQQHEYWGIDLQSGQRLWQYPLKGEGRISYYDAKTIANNIFVVQCHEDRMAVPGQRWI